MENKEFEMKPTKRHHLTIEELRNYKGCENLSDEKATEVLNSIKEFSIILCYLFKRIQKHGIHIADSQCNIIPFEHTKENKKAA